MNQADKENLVFVVSPIDLKTWWPRYAAIIDQFSYDVRTDQEAADLLSQYIKHVSFPLEEARNIIKGKNVVVCGAGPSIKKNLEAAIATGLFEDSIIFAANGATTACLEKEVKPHFIMTDLDGNMEDILAAHQDGAILIVHAHGDNISALNAWVPRFNQQQIIGSTQAKPQPGVHNLGGFTDGDRCVFWAEGLLGARIALLGMDLGKFIGRYSKPGLTRDVLATPLKRQKLSVARELLSWLASWSQSQLVNLTGVNTSIPGIPNARIKTFTWSSLK